MYIKINSYIVYISLVLRILILYYYTCKYMYATVCVLLITY